MNPTIDRASALTRRDALKSLFVGATILGIGSLQQRLSAVDGTPGSFSGFTLPALPYSYDALEPHFDARTMEVHHSKHHQSYVTAANKALTEIRDFHRFSPEEIIGRLDQAPENLRVVLQNQLGGHVNHSFFWKVLSPQGGGQPDPLVFEEIQKAFGGWDAFQAVFTQTALTRFGSGWAWLVYFNRKLTVVSTANQDSPLAEGRVPILGIDVWEHAYYLKYQNRRAEYLKAFWSVINWPQVSQNLVSARAAS